MTAAIRASSTTRVWAYAALAELFAEPSLALATDLEAQLAALAAGGVPTTASDTLATFCLEHPEPEARLTALWAEYIPLFVSGRPTAAPPYEAYYHGKGTWSPTVARDIEATYRAHGLAFAGHAGELPDHVAAECEFLAWLLDDPGRAGFAPVFFTQHLATFAFTLLDRVEATGRPFYAALAAAARGFLAAEQRRFQGGDAL